MREAHTISMPRARRRILVLQDFRVRPGGLHEQLPLDPERYRVDVVDSDMPRSFRSRLSKMLLLWPGYFDVALRGWWRARRGDVVLARQGNIGLFLAALQRLLERDRPRLIVVGYIYVERSGLAGWLRKWFCRWTAPAIETAVVGSTVEIETYHRQLGLPREIFVSLPPSMYAMPIVDEDQAVEPEESDVDTDASAVEPYILAAGRSLRDYRTLALAADGLPCRVLVIAAAYNLTGIDFPDNVTVRQEVHGDAFCALVAGARAVVVPLETAEVAAGQMVVLQAMAARRPVVASDTPCLREYIQDGDNGLLVPLGDADALRATLAALLEDRALRDRLGLAGYQTWQQEFTQEAYAHKLARLLERPR